MSTKNHEYFMRQCVELAKEALANGNPPVGAIIVKDEEIVGQGIEAGKSKGDITFHAEIEAVRHAVKKLNRKDLSDCSLYTTHEPCIMCSYVIRHHAVKEVVIGSTVKAIGGLTSIYPILIAKDIEIWSAPPLIVENVCNQECKALTQQYGGGRDCRRDVRAGSHRERTTGVGNGQRLSAHHRAESASRVVAASQAARGTVAGASGFAPAIGACRQPEVAAIRKCRGYAA